MRFKQETIDLIKIEMLQTKQFNNNSYFSKVMLSLESASKRYSVHYTMYSLRNKIQFIPAISTDNSDWTYCGYWDITDAIHCTPNNCITSSPLSST